MPIHLQKYSGTLHNLWKNTHRFWNSVIETIAVSMRFLFYALKIDYSAMGMCVCMRLHAYEPMTWTMEVLSLLNILREKKNDLLMLLWNQIKYCEYCQHVCLDLPGFLFKRHLFSNSWKVNSHEGQEVMLNKPGGMGNEVRPDSRQAGWQYPTKKDGGRLLYQFHLSVYLL